MHFITHTTPTKTYSPVKILVRFKQKLYTLPKVLLYNYSPYLIACLNGGFKEGSKGILRLPEDGPRYFHTFVEYIKCGSCAQA